MPQSSVDSDFTRTINGQRYLKSRGRLLQLGEDAPARKAGGVGVASVHEDGTVTPIVADLTVDPEAAMQRLIATVGAGEFDPHEPDPMREEIGRLLDLGLVNAAESLKASTGYKDPEPLGPLKLGRVLMSPKALGQVNYHGVVRGNCHLAIQVVPFSTADVRELLRRHAGGDWGEFGKSADVVVTDDARWAPQIADWSQRNAVAIEAGQGLVRSAYSVDVLPKARLDARFSPAWIVRPQLESLDIVTLVNRMTVIWPRWSGVGF